MSTMPAFVSGHDQPAVMPAGAVTVTTMDGSVISGVIAGLTAHTWTADANGLFHTATNLAAEWSADYAQMIDGHAAQLTALQRMEGNAEAVIEHTAAAKMSPIRQAAFREDAQREFDAIDAAMRIDQVQYAIDPALQFNAYTYARMEQTLQADERLQELGYQGHGLNDSSAAKYSGFTTDFQNKTDGKTYFVGGGPGNGEHAIAAFFDDDVLTHAPFPVVAHNGALDQLNQNGNIENTVADAVAAANAAAYTRVFVASDFSTDKTAAGEVRLVPTPAAPGLPVAAPGQVTTLDGSVIAGTIGITAHVWVADATGLFHTAADLKTEWAGDYQALLQGAALNPLQHWEANAEAVLENTGASKLPAAKQEAFREDAQREFDAVWAAMQINAQTLGLSASAPFTTHSYLMMEQTLRFNESLEELAVQGHGLNHAPAAKYDGFTETFQNHTDNTTLYTGAGLDSGEKAIADFFDDAIITHASFPTVPHNGALIQLNQNGTREDTIGNVVIAANDIMFTQTLVSSDFTHPKPAVKAKVGA